MECFRLAILLNPGFSEFDLLFLIQMRVIFIGPEFLMVQIDNFPVYKVQQIELLNVIVSESEHTLQSLYEYLRT